MLLMMNLFYVYKKYRKYKPNICKYKKRKNDVLSECVVCDNKKSKFVKEQEANGLLSSLGIKIL